MERCVFCQGPLPPWKGNGRPRLYCGNTCRDRARILRGLQETAEMWSKRGYPERAAHVQRVIDQHRAAWIVRRKPT